MRSIQEMIRLPVGLGAVSGGVSEIVEMENRVTMRNNVQILNPGGSLMVRSLCTRQSHIRRTIGKARTIGK